MEKYYQLSKAEIKDYIKMGLFLAFLGISCILLLLSFRYNNNPSDETMFFTSVIFLILLVSSLFVFIYRQQRRYTTKVVDSVYDIDIDEKDKDVFLKFIEREKERLERIKKRDKGYCFYNVRSIKADFYNFKRRYKDKEIDNFIDINGL